jgi:hypothetical protein
VIGKKELVADKPLKLDLVDPLLVEADCVSQTSSR